MFFGKNLRYLRRRGGLSQTDVGILLHKHDSTIQRYETGENEPSLEHAAMLASFFNVSLNDMVNKDLSVAPRANDDAPDEEQAYSYPFWDVGISARLPETTEAAYSLPTVAVPDVMLGRHARSRHLLFMRVNGESMNNVIADGAIIAVRTDVESSNLSNGDIIVASLDFGYTVKRFYNLPEASCILLRPDSTDPSFPEIRINYEDADNFKIIGRVVIYQVTL